MCDDPAAVLPKAKFISEVRAARGGFVTAVDAMSVALAALRLGAGRMKAEDAVDHAVGFTRLIKVGAPVAAGDVIGVVHASDEAKLEEARAWLEDAVAIGDAAPATAPMIVEKVG